MAKWQDSYKVGHRVEYLMMGKWVPGVISRRTATGQPEVAVRYNDGSTHYFGNGQLRKSDLRPSPVLTPDVLRVREEIRMARYWTSTDETKAAETGWLVALFWVFEALDLTDRS